MINFKKFLLLEAQKDTVENLTGVIMNHLIEKGLLDEKGNPKSGVTLDKIKDAVINWKIANSNKNLQKTIDYYAKMDKTPNGSTKVKTDPNDTRTIKQKRIDAKNADAETSNSTWAKLSRILGHGKPFSDKFTDAEFEKLANSITGEGKNPDDPWGLRLADFLSPEELTKVEQMVIHEKPGDDPDALFKTPQEKTFFKIVMGVDQNNAPVVKHTLDDVASYFHISKPAAKKAFDNIFRRLRFAEKPDPRKGFQGLKFMFAPNPKDEEKKKKEQGANYKAPPEGYPIPDKTLDMILNMLTGTQTADDRAMKADKKKERTKERVKYNNTYFVDDPEQLGLRSNATVGDYITAMSDYLGVGGDEEDGVDPYTVDKYGKIQDNPAAKHDLGRAIYTTIKKRGKGREELMNPTIDKDGNELGGIENIADRRRHGSDDLEW